MLLNRVFGFVNDRTLVYTILRTYVRYSCRLCGSAEVRALYQQLPLSLQERIGLYDLKSSIDYSIYRNTLYHAIWLLTQQKRPHFRITAREHHLDPEALKYYYEQVLTSEERNTISQVDKPTAFSESDTLRVVKSIRKAIRSSTYHRLRYLYENDSGHSKEDFHAELECEAIKIVRKYEVQNITVDKMIPLAAQGIRNRATNIAIFYGQDFRNPLIQIKQRTNYKTLWYCDVGSEEVLQVRAFTHFKYRTGEYILARVDDKDRYVYQHRLYDSQQDAQNALSDYLSGNSCHRKVLVDLTSDEQDDWQSTLSSLDQPIEPGTTTPMLELIPSPEKLDYESAKICLDDLLQGENDSKTHMFLMAVTGQLGPLFEAYVNRNTGKSSAELSSLALGRIARRYCGVNLKTITSRLELPTI